MSLGKYVKTAFMNRWNLLAFLGGLGFAVLSGMPDVIAPLVLAAEVGYLGLLSTRPRFQLAVDAQEAKAAREALHNVEKLSIFLKVLGSYPKAKRRT